MPREYTPAEIKKIIQHYRGQLREMLARDKAAFELEMARDLLELVEIQVDTARQMKDFLDETLIEVKLMNAAIRADSEKLQAMSTPDAIAEAMPSKAMRLCGSRCRSSRGVATDRMAMHEPGER